MATAPGDGIDLLAPYLGHQRVSEPAGPEVSEDVSLVRAAQNGDRTAFGHLYQRYARMVHGILLAKVPLSEVNDLVQDVFLLALRRLATLREAGRFGAWLAAIARNRASDYHRHSLPEDPVLDDDNFTAELGYGNASGHPEDLATRILDLIKSLPEAYRETLILRLVEGMTGPEIAARIGITHGSVRVNLHRGMQLLRAKLSPTKQRSEQETP